MCTIMLAIKPQYVDAIRSEAKDLEFRRSIPKRKVDKILIYESSPIMKVVGEATVDGIYHEKISNLWKISNKRGINKKDFMSYFTGKETGYAYRLANVIFYENSYELSDYDIKHAPQSFRYIN